ASSGQMGVVINAHDAPDSRSGPSSIALDVEDRMEANGGPPWLSMIVMTRQKPSATPPQKDPLAEFLSDPESRKLSTAEFVSRGVTHVTERHLDRLVPRLHALRERIAKINDSPLLQSRLLVFADFLAATHHGPEAAQPARREAAFALAYF